MPPEVSPTVTPPEWPASCSKDQTYAEYIASTPANTTPAQNGESKMATFFKLHSLNQGLNTTNRALLNGVQNASSLSQSSENLASEISTSCPSILVPRGMGSPKIVREKRSQTCTERLTHCTSTSSNSDDVVLPQELYQKLFVSRPDRNSDFCKSGPFILLDCRPTKAFRQKHIDGALNVNCSNRLYCRRLRDGKISIADLVTSEEGKIVLREPTERNKEIIVYDDDTQGTDNLPTSHPTLLVLSRLRKEGTRASLLKGGIRAFEQRYSEMCNTDFHNGNQTSTIHPPHLDSPGIENRPPPCDTPSIDAPMARILPHIYVGGDKDAADLSELRRNGINYILNVTNKIPCYHQSNANFTYLRIPVKDNGSENLLTHFDVAFQFIEQARQTNGRVLIHCQAGISRSSTVAIGYIMKYLNMTMSQAYSKVQACRPIIAPNLNFVGQLAKYEKTLQATRAHQMKLEKVSCGVQAHNSRPSTPIAEIDMV